VEPFLIASSVAVVLAQRLVRRVCEHCKSEVELPEIKKNEIKKQLEIVPASHLEKIGLDMKEMKFYKGLGCEYCGNSGFKGRISLFEVMEMTESLQQLSIQKSSGNAIFDQAVKEGMITMRQDGFMKALQGITTLDEVYRVTTK
jgi:type II secretory ATPase GspE/PulE/Tfp pilus assembly ATPase PilB-like protein